MKCFHRVLFAASIGAATAAFLACGEDDEAGSQPPPGANDASSDGNVPGADADPGGDAGPDVITYPDPLAGTTKVATLVKGGFGFTEGPVWIGGRLLFTDLNSNTIHELLPDGGTAPFRTSSGRANGLAVDPQGNLLACEGANKRVTRSPAQGNAMPMPVASTYMGEPFNEPNDVIVRSDGNVYFTDPRYGSATMTQDDEAVYRIAPPSQGGGITRLAHDFTRPNGIALSPDGNTLYVVDNGAGEVLSAPVMPNGEVGAFTKIADAPGGDGMAVDDAGNIYVTDDNGVDVFDKTGQTKIGTITVAVKPANCTFGGPDRKTLYITANGGNGNAATGLYEMKLNVPGLP